MNGHNHHSATKSILVTGGSGLVGNELIRQLLQQGEKVKAIVNKSPLSINHENLEIAECDILDVIGLEAVMENVDIVYHCAGFISYAPQNKSRLYKINVEGTANMVNAALLADVEKFIHVSSIAALGKFTQGKIIDETIEWTDDAKNSVYGHSKYLGELEVWRGIAEGLNAAIVNPSIILGPGNKWEGSTAIFKNIHDGFAWYTEGVNGFVDVRDVALSMIMLAESKISAEKFILNASNELYRDIFFMIADALHKPRPKYKITHTLAGLVWRLEQFKGIFSQKEPLVTKETASTALAIVKFDNQKLLQALPQFTYRSMKDTIEFTCEKLKQKLNNQ